MKSSFLHKFQEVKRNILRRIDKKSSNLPLTNKFLCCYGTSYRQWLCLHTSLTPYCCPRHPNVLPFACPTSKVHSILASHTRRYEPVARNCAYKRSYVLPKTYVGLYVLPNLYVRLFAVPNLYVFSYVLPNLYVLQSSTTLSYTMDTILPGLG